MSESDAPSTGTWYPDAPNVITAVRRSGIALWVENGRIKADPGSKLTPAFKAAIYNNYAAIQDELRTEELLLQDVYEPLRDPATGEVAPNRMVFAEPLPGDKIRARLGTYTISNTAEVVQLVDIFAPAEGRTNDGETGMKGLTFRVLQLPELLRALHKVYVEAVKRGWIPTLLK